MHTKRLAAYNSLGFLSESGGQGNDRFTRHPAPTWQAVVVDQLRELAVREAMFEHLRKLVVDSSSEAISRRSRQPAFSFAGETIVMRQTRGHGIHNPASSTPRCRSPLRSPASEDNGPMWTPSVKTDIPRYKYEGTDLNLATNRALRAAMESKLPLAYFIGVRRSVYEPVFPVYIAGDDPTRHEFVLSFSRGEVGLDLSTLTAPEKVYAARMTKQRLHQPVFREQVLRAYSSSCAVCRLRHVGIARCRAHHW